MVPILDSLQIPVGIEAVVFHLDDRHGNVRTVVRNALTVVQNVREDEPFLNGTRTLLKAPDVLILHLGNELVDDLLQRLHPSG